MNSSDENDGYLYFRRSTTRRKRNKNPHSVILAGRRGSRYSDCKKTKTVELKIIGRLKLIDKSTATSKLN